MTSYVLKPVRSAAILTGSYVAGTVLGIDELRPELNSEMVVLVKFTKGSLDSASVKIEFSPDNSTYYQETASSISGTTSTLSLLEHTMSATGNYRIPVPIKDSYIKISALGTGTATNSTMTIDAIVGV